MAQTFMDRHAFLLRRLHSLSGVVPIGVFMMIHLTTNASVVWGLAKGEAYEGLHPGAYTFQHEVNFIHSMPGLLLIEVFGLWLPIAFHAVLGAFYAAKGKNNLQRYSRQNNWRYTLQRLTAWVGLLFIFWHVATLRWGWTFLLPGGVTWDAEFAGSTLAAIFQGRWAEAGHTLSPDADVNPLAASVVSIAYMVGVSALIFHLANGLWTAAITWGVTLSAKAQQRWGYVCAAIWVGLMGAGWSAVIGFMTLDYDRALDAERHLGEHGVEVEHEPMVHANEGDAMAIFYPTDENEAPEGAH